MINARKKRTGLITLIVLLLFACLIVVLCLLFVQNYLIFTPDGVRLDLSGKQTTQSLNVVVKDALFAPTAAPAVLIEDAELPPP